MARFAPRILDGQSRAGRAVWFAGLGAAAGGLVSLVGLLIRQTIDSPGALAAFWVSGPIVAGAVTWCWLHGSGLGRPSLALFSALGGLTIGALIEWGATQAFAISSGDTGLWVAASSVMWGAYGCAGARSMERGEGAGLGFNAVRTLVGVSMIRFLAIVVFRAEWMWVLWLHDALQAIGWRLGLAVSGSMRPAMTDTPA
jgi:hypothetical protein